jgi:hypothetical protein
MTGNENGVSPRLESLALAQHLESVAQTALSMARGNLWSGDNGNGVREVTPADLLDAARLLRSAPSEPDASSKAVTQALVEVHDRIMAAAAFSKRHGFDEFGRGMQEAAETVRLMMEGK